jgi:hypothetical protein
MRPRYATPVSALAALILILLANDFILKATFPNYLTGKLSDFAGLAALALFVRLLAPRYTAPVFIAIAALFAWWKSPLAGWFIDAANGVLPFPIGRVVDPSDLAALVMLPIVHVVWRSAEQWRPKRAREWAMVAVSVFAFGASEGTIPTEFVFNNEYRFAMPVDSLQSAIRAFQGPTRFTQEYDRFLIINIPWRCSHGLDADTHVLPTGSGSLLRLERLSSLCDPEGTHASQALLLFEDSVITRLRQAD